MMKNFFKLSDNNTSFQTEILAGITTFIAGMYIIIVNPGILADAGIPYSAGLTATVLSKLLLDFFDFFSFSLDL